MSDPRASSYRFRMIMLVVIGAIAALGSFWVLDVMQRGIEASTPKAKRTEPDYYVEQFNFVRMAKTGQARYHISGARMTHNPQDDSYEIKLPVVKSLSVNQPPMTIRAERALADPNTSKVQLYDKVVMDRPASATSERIHVTSDYLMVLPDEDVMKTHRPVEILFGNSTLQGVGMFANQTTREFRLGSQVRGTYQNKTPG